MNLNIRQANATKSYVVTDVCTTRPRIAIKNGNNVSYLPLTTSAKQGFGLRNKVNGVNYRPLEYQSMSTSATYYTTAVASNGLSSTTALTRSSTSQTVYHTCSSTSGTSYLTRSSTSGTSYLTQSINEITASYYYTASDYYYWQAKYIYHHATASYVYTAKTSYEQTYSQWSVGGYVTLTQTVTALFNTSVTGYATNMYNYWLTMYAPNAYRCTYGIGSQSFSYYTNNPSYSSYSESRTVFRAFGTDSTYTITATTTSKSYANMANTSWSYTYQTYGDNGYTKYGQTYTQGYVTLTTGTSYLTRSSTSATSYLTRSSTSRTEYKTRESTSGYSGVSSSSSQSSGWL